MHPLCAHYRFMTLVKRKGGGWLSYMSDFQIQTTMLSSVVLHILSNERLGGLSVRHLQHPFGESRKETNFEWMRARELLTSSATSALAIPLMHSSSVKQFSWFSRLCACDSEQ